MSSPHRSVPRFLHRRWPALIAALVVAATLFAASPAWAADLLEVEPNGTTATAQPLPLDSTVTATFTRDSCSNYADCDFYKITSESPGRLELDLRFSDLLGTTASFTLDVLNGAGTTTARFRVPSTGYDGAGLRSKAMYVDAGVSYLSLRAETQGTVWSNAQYTLKASVAPGVVETEWNGTDARADVISLGTTVAGSILTTSDCANYTDCDYFRLAVPDASQLQADFQFPCDLGTQNLYTFTTYDNSGRQITSTRLRGSDCEGRTLRSVPIVAPPGNVYFRVYGDDYGLTSGEEYTLTVTRTDTPAPDVEVTRLAGSDRQGTAVEISKATFAPGVPVTYVATGAKFPDALAAAPAAATQGGPLLLVDRDTMSRSVRDELSRLQPTKIVVVGSALSVGDGLLNELRAYAGSGGIQRIGGVDRYDTADRIIRYAFPSGSSRAWIATGEKFPDALGASAAAGSVDAPVLLVNGGQASATPATRQLLTDLGTSSLTIAGSSLSVSEGIRGSLGVPSTRIGGTDRYDTSEQLNRAAFTAAETVYFATGENFPDALAGATAAGYTSSPLFAVRPDCVPRKVLDDITTLGADRVILLGGPGTLSDDVARLKAC